MPSYHPRAVRQTRGREHLIRFVFGGFVTVATGLVARSFGPEIGGLFLAFPAILPASLTLVKDHDGRHEAAQVAAGSRLGAVALIAFALAVALLAERGAATSLTVAMVLWAAVSLLSWRFVYGKYGRRARRRRTRGVGTRDRTLAGLAYGTRRSRDLSRR